MSPASTPPPHLGGCWPWGFPLAGLHGKIWPPALCHGLGSRTGCGRLRDKLASARSSSSLCQGWGTAFSSSTGADAEAEATVTWAGAERVLVACPRAAAPWLLTSFAQTKAGQVLGRTRFSPHPTRLSRAKASPGLSILRSTSSWGRRGEGSWSAHPCAAPALPAVPGSHAGPGPRCGQGWWPRGSTRSWTGGSALLYTGFAENGDD